MKIIEVDWVDSHNQGGWHRKAESEEAKNWDSLECRTVGYLVAENKERLVLVQSESFGTKQFDNSMHIPKKAISKIKILKK